MKLTVEEKRRFCESSIQQWGYDLCYKIAHNPKDVCYNWYSKIFEDFDWDDPKYKNIKGWMNQ